MTIELSVTPAEAAFYGEHFSNISTAPNLQVFKQAKTIVLQQIVEDCRTGQKQVDEKKIGETTKYASLYLQSLAEDKILIKKDAGHIY